MVVSVALERLTPPPGRSRRGRGGDRARLRRAEGRRVSRWTPDGPPLCVWPVREFHPDFIDNSYCAHTHGS